MMDPLERGRFTSTRARAVLVILLILPGLSSCLVRTVDPARITSAAPSADFRVSATIWPPRPRPTGPTYTVKQGRAPVDAGVFGNCRLYEAGNIRDGIALLVAGSRFEPVPEEDEPFGLTVLDPEQTNEIDFEIHDHRITLAVVRSAKGKQTRGLVLYLSSIMLISEDERAFLRKLQRRGWNVVALTPSLGLFSENRWNEAWSEEELEVQADIMAREIDNHLAETAYAAESVLAYLQRRRPEWSSGPRVVIGASAGALAAPAVVERLEGVDAAVLIGGGGHVAEVVLESTLDIYQPEIQLHGEQSLTRDEREARLRNLRDRFKRLVLERSRLDPLSLAPAVRDIPTLVLSSDQDRIVPAHNGDLLYQALEGPERWRFPLGHVLLFLGLPFQADRVSDWMASQVQAPSTPDH